MTALGALLVGWLGGETAAQACGTMASITRQHVVGVAPDGTFVTISKDAISDVEGAIPSFEVHDADGVKIGSLSLDEPGASEQPEPAASTDTDGIEPAASTDTDGIEPAVPLTSGRTIDGDFETQFVLERLPGGTDPRLIERALIEHYHLTPLRTSPLKAHVPPPLPASDVVDESPPLVNCDMVHVRAREGLVPVLDVGAIDAIGICSRVSVTALRHPASSLIFLQLAYVVTGHDCSSENGCDNDTERVAWVPALRLAGVRAAERGRQALAAGQPRAALAALDEALRLAPDYVRARLWTMQALAASHAPAAMAQRWVEMPFSPTEACFGGDTAKLDLWLDRLAPDSWHVDGSWGRPWKACSGEASDTPPEPTSDDTAEPETTAGTDDGPESSDEPSPDADADAPPADDVSEELAVITPVAPALEAPRSVWWFDPGSTLLGVAAALSFALAYRRGFRSRR